MYSMWVWHRSRLMLVGHRATQLVGPWNRVPIESDDNEYEHNFECSFRLLYSCNCLLKYRAHLWYLFAEFTGKSILQTVNGFWFADFQSASCNVDIDVGAETGRDRGSIFPVLNPGDIAPHFRLSCMQNYSVMFNSSTHAQCSPVYTLYSLLFAFKVNSECSREHLEHLKRSKTIRPAPYPTGGAYSQCRI